MKLTIVLTALTFTAFFAGCLGGSAETGGGVDASGAGALNGLPETSAEAQIAKDRGALTGYVLTEQFTPIAGALVSLDGGTSETTSAQDGSYTFSLLEPKTYEVRADAEGHHPAVQSADVEAGAVTRLGFQLERIPGLVAHHDLFEFKAFLECGTGFALTQKPALDAARDPANQAADALEPVPFFGFDGFVDRYVRLIPEEWNETQGVGLLANTCALAVVPLEILDEEADTSFTGAASNDAFLFEWEHNDSTVQEIVLEMAWSSFGASGRKFSVTVEPVVPASERKEACQETEATDCPTSYGYPNLGYTFLRTSGASPLRATIDREDLVRVTEAFNAVETVEGATPGETATGNPVMVEQDFTQRAMFMVRIFPVADQMGQAPADYALAFQQPLDLYVSQFYVEGAPEGYTAIPE